MPSESPSRIRWLLVVWLTVVSAVSYLDRVNISIAGTSLASDFHLDQQQLGFIFSAFTIGYALFQIAGGLLADRFGPRRILALGAVWWAVFTSLTAAISTRIAAALFVFCAVRFFLGAGEAVMYPSSNRWVANWVPTAECGLATGIIFMGVGGGAALTPPIITFVMTRYGWRVSFWVCAVIGLAVGAVWFLIARDLPDHHPWVNDAERERIRLGIQASATPSHSRFLWGALLGSGDVWALTLSYFCFSYAAYMFFSWFFIYLTAVRGMDLRSGSFYSALPFIAISLGSATGGFIGDRVSRHFGRRLGRAGIAIFGLAAAAAIILVGSRAATPAAASIILASGAGALYLSSSSYWAMTADLGGGSAGMLSGFMNMGGQIGSAVTASSTPFIAKHFGWTASFAVAACFCCLGALLWFVVNPNREPAAA
jgi:ACS family glucarate transporter-like MFS transporter